MPYNITWETEGLLIKWYGNATPEENIKSNGEIYGNDKFDSIKYQIADFLDANTSQFSDKETSVVAKLESKASIWNRNLKVAHVATDPDLIYQIKLYEQMLKDTNWQFGIFSSVNDARKWVEEVLISQ